MLPVQFFQEYPMNDIECFQFSGAVLIERDILYRHRQRQKDPIEKIRDLNARIDIWDIPTKESLKKEPRSFFVGVDTAEGLNKDYSACHLISVNEARLCKQAMVIHGFVPPGEFAVMVRKYVCQFFSSEGNPEAFNNKPFYPQICVERNNHGHAFLSVLRREQEYLYPNIYISMKDRRPGFFTTHNSRKGLLGELLTAVRNEEIEIYDKTTIDEFFTLTINDQQKIEAEEGYHDDNVFGLGLAFHSYYYSPIGFGFNPTIEQKEIEF